MKKVISTFKIYWDGTSATAGSKILGHSIRGAHTEIAQQQNLPKINKYIYIYRERESDAMVLRVRISNLKVQMADPNR
jgi:hypothetical protein